MTEAEITASFNECIRRLGGPVGGYEWDGGLAGEEPDLFVSDADAAHLQRAVDARLVEIWGPR